MKRSDISPTLIHFTKSPNALDDDEGAFARLKAIIQAGSLKPGRNGCICFTEAPIDSVRNGLITPSGRRQYSLFGFMYRKKFIFGLGGRPVIYGPIHERKDFAVTLHWRYQPYNPIGKGKDWADFSWEREWRFMCKELPVTPVSAVVVVPSTSWADRLKRELSAQEDFKVQQYKLIMDEQLAETHRQSQSWPVYWLKSDGMGTVPKK